MYNTKASQKETAAWFTLLETKRGTNLCDKHCDVLTVINNWLINRTNCTGKQNKLYRQITFNVMIYETCFRMWKLYLPQQT